MPVVTLGLFALVGSVNAELVIDHGPSFTAGTEYHSNLRLAAADKESTYIFTLVPSYNVVAEDGKNQWSGVVGLYAERSSNSNVSGNREDPFAVIGWKRLLENGEVGLSTAYVRTSTRDTQFTETGIFTRNGTSVSRSITADWKHGFTEKLNLAMQAGYEKVKFSNSPALSNFEDRYIYSDLFYTLNEEITPFARFGANDFRSKTTLNNNQIKYQDYLVGAIFTIAPAFVISAATGITHFSSLGNNANPNIDKNEWVAVMKGEYEGNRYTIDGTLSREVNPTSIGDIQLADQLSANYIYSLSEKSELGTSIVLSQNSNNLDTQNVRGFYARNLTENLQMEFALAFRNQKSENANSVNDNVIGINFTYHIDRNPELTDLPTYPL